MGSHEPPPSPTTSALPEHIYWSHWSSWSPCSRSACGSSGTQTRQRRCVNAQVVAALKELKCKGKAVERRACSAGPCPGRDPPALPALPLAPTCSLPTLFLKRRRGDGGGAKRRPFPGRRNVGAGLRSPVLALLAKVFLRFALLAGRLRLSSEPPRGGTGCPMGPQPCSGCPRADAAAPRAMCPRLHLVSLIAITEAELVKIAWQGRAGPSRGLDGARVAGWRPVGWGLHGACVPFSTCCSSAALSPVPCPLLGGGSAVPEAHPASPCRAHVDGVGGVGALFPQLRQRRDARPPPELQERQEAAVRRAPRRGAEVPPLALPRYLSLGTRGRC